MLPNHRMRHLAVVLLVSFTTLRPAAAQKQEYNRPIDCKVSAWGAWSTCTEKCGGGTQTRSRDIKTEPKYKGKSCPSLEQTQTCNEDECFTFVLGGNTGNEQVIVEKDGEMGDILTLPEWGKAFLIKVNRKREVRVHVLNAMFDQYGNENTSPSCTLEPGKNCNKVYFRWGDNLYLGGRWGVAGEGPEYVYSQGGFNCGAEDENSMCPKVRKGKFFWTGVYEFTFPLEQEQEWEPPLSSGGGSLLGGRRRLATQELIDGSLLRRRLVDLETAQAAGASISTGGADTD